MIQNEQEHRWYLVTSLAILRIVDPPTDEADTRALGTLGWLRNLFFLGFGSTHLFAAAPLVLPLRRSRTWRDCHWCQNASGVGKKEAEWNGWVEFSRFEI